MTNENLREYYDEQRLPVIVAKIRELIAKATDSVFFEAKAKEESKDSDPVAQEEEESDPVAEEESIIVAPGAGEQ